MCTRYLSKWASGCNTQLLLGYFAQKHCVHFFLLLLVLYYCKYSVHEEVLGHMEKRALLVMEDEMWFFPLFY